MEVTGGSMSYSLLFDISQGEVSAEKFIDILKQMGFSAEKVGKMIDDFSQSLTSSLQDIIKEAPNADKAINSLRASASDAYKEASKLGDGLEKEKLEAFSKGLNEAADALEENKDGFDELKKAAGGAIGEIDATKTSEDALAKSASWSAKAFLKSSVAVKALSAALKSIGIGLVITALTEGVKLLWQFASGTLAAERAAAKFKMTLSSLDFDLKNMKLYAENMEDIYDATYMSREELRKFREEQAQLRLQKAVENENAMYRQMEEKGEKSVSDEDFKKTQELTAKARADLAKIRHQNKLDELQEQKDQKQYDYNAYQEQLNTQEAQIELLKDGYDKRAKEIKVGREKERAALQHVLDTADPRTMTESQRRDINEQIRLSEEAEAKELADLYHERNASIIEAQKALKDSEYNIQQERIDHLNEQMQTEIDLMQDGTAKEIAQMKLDHDLRILEIEREAKEEADARAEDNKQKWINEQTAKGRIVSEADYYSSSYYKGLSNGLTEEQQAQIDKDQAYRTAAQNALYAKQYREMLQQMLTDYGDYTTQKEAIDKKYYDDIAVLEKQLMQAQIGGDYDLAERLKNAINEAKKAQAKATLQLDLDTIDTTAYATVEEKMVAINAAYEKYIESIKLAGASIEEQNAAYQEQVELTGKLATINAQIAAKEAEKMIAVENGDIEKVKKLNEEIRKLKKQLDDIEKISNNKTLGTMFKEWAQELKASDIIGASGELGDVIANIGETAGNKAIAGFGQALSFAGDIGAKIASGDYLGAALSIITDIGNAIVEDTAKTQEFQRAMRQAAVDADLLRIATMMDSGDTIFGTSYIENVKGLNDALDAAKEKLDEYKRQANRPNMYMYDANDAVANWDALNALFGQKVFKTIDYSGFSNFFGKADEFDTLQNFAKRNNLELYDEYDNLNVKVLELFKETYKDLSEEDKQWIDNVIEYSKQYETAMEELSSYMTDLFGNVADTIADQFINSFLESGQAAMDFDAVVSDVARNMVKNLIRSMIIDDVLKKYTDDFKKIITSDEYEKEEARSAALLSLFMQMGGEIEGLQPAIQTLLETWQQYIGDLDVATASMGGNLLQSASQDSVDMLNGQLNAVRTNQALMVGRVDSVILQLSGIYNEVRDFRGDSNRRLDQLIDNTSERGSIARAFGLA